MLSAKDLSYIYCFENPRNTGFVPFTLQGRKWADEYTARNINLDTSFPSLYLIQNIYHGASFPTRGLDLSLI